MFTIEIRKKSLTDDKLGVGYLQNTKPRNRINIVNKQMSYAEPLVVINNLIMPSRNAVMPSYKTRTRNQRVENFHKAIGPILVLGQIFGQMPVRGVLGGNASSLRYVFFSWRVFHSWFCMFGGCLLTCFCVARLFTLGVKIHTISMVVFYGSTFLTSILFYRLSSRWPNLCRAIENEETRSALKYNQRTTLTAKFKYFSSVFLFSALVEHIWCIISGVAMVYGCDHDNPLLIGYFTSSFPQVFSYTAFDHWKAVILQIYNSCATFNWIYMDLFIILMSIHLANRFDMLNSSIEVAKGKHFPEYFWRVARNNYASLAQLVVQVDENINELVLLSFANNLYIICMQLFNTLNTGRDDNSTEIPCWKKLYDGVLTTTYFVFSFIFLISRFLAVSLSASRINANSRIPLETLFSIRSETYSIEVQRFINHITNDVVALTGLKFFHITRGLILTIAGTVITYELVLVQFNQPSPSVHANITVKDSCGGIDSIRT